MARDATALARKFKLDVNTGTSAAPVWVQLTGVTAMKPNIAPVIQESTDYEDAGSTGNQKTAYGWSVEVTFRRSQNSVGAYPTAQEFLRGKQLLLGAAAEAEVRWYERDAGPEAYQGTAVVAWERVNDGANDLDYAKVMLTGNGVLTAITNPLA